MKNNIFKKIVKQIKSMTDKEYNKLPEQSKEMEKDYLIQLKNIMEDHERRKTF